MSSTFLVFFIVLHNNSTMLQLFKNETEKILHISVWIAAFCSCNPEYLNLISYIHWQQTFPHFFFTLQKLKRETGNKKKSCFLISCITILRAITLTQFEESDTKYFKLLEFRPKTLLKEIDHQHEIRVSIWCLEQREN